MPTYVSLLRRTDQGIKNAKDSMVRAEQASNAASQAGGRISAVYWLQGAYDAVIVSEFPDEETAQAALLGLGMQGNVRSETLRVSYGDTSPVRMARWVMLRACSNCSYF